MAATVQIAESNGSGQTVTANISNTNMGSADMPNLNPVAYPIVAGENSYEKWQRFSVTAMGGSSVIDTLKVWRTGALAGATAHVTNARTTGYAGAATYATPTATDSTVATQTMPTSEPAGANVGIGGSLTGQHTAVGYSDYFVHQLQTDSSDVAGNTTTLNYQYDEIA